MKTLVTGGSGFVGRHCLPELVERGAEVHVVGRSTPRTRVEGVQYHHADLLTPGEAAKLLEELEPSHLLHLAWYVEHGRFWNAPENLSWVRASLELIEAFAAHGGTRAVFAGTCAEYDWDAGLCSESVTPLAPATLYGTSKDSLRRLASAFAKEKGVSFAWGRIFFMYGQAEPENRLVPSVIRSLLAGEPAKCTSGGQIRDFLFVEDVARAFVSLLESGVEGEVNIGSGVPTTVRDVVSAISAEVGREDLVQIGALPDRDGDPPMILADVGRLRDEVGWTPEFTLSEGLERTIEWWKQRT